MSLFLSRQHDPYLNLAMEAELLREGSEACYLWVNSPCVVIGRNQNPYRECNLAHMDELGVRLVRRTSGGGAVYHDLGCLNYSFVAPSDRDDHVRKIVGACLSRVGVEAVFSGRNDMEVGGRKVGGMAWYQDDAWLCHGTLLVETDLDELEATLRPSPLKLRSRGIESVRARVANLGQLHPGVTPNGLIDAFAQTLGTAPNLLEPSPWAAAEAQRLATDAWLYGQTPFFEACHEIRMADGLYQIGLQVENGVVTDAAVSTDSLDPHASEALRQRLRGMWYETLLENWLQESRAEGTCSPSL